MLDLQRTDDGTFTFVSDDANAENAVLGDAIEEAAPQFSDDFSATSPGTDGMLRFDFTHDHWEPLADVIEALALGEMPPASMEDLDRWEQMVKAAREEIGERA